MKDDHSTNDLPLAVLTFIDQPCDAYLIWSFEHGGWWRAGAMGYTPDAERAGVFTLDQARQIVGDANRYTNGVFNEAALPARLARGIKGRYGF